MEDRSQEERKHIFAINGSPDFLNVIRDLFQEEGYNVTTTNFVPNSFEQIAALDPDALIVDIVFGQRAGWNCWSRSTPRRPRPASRSSSSRPIPACWSVPRSRRSGTGRTAI